MNEFTFILLWGVWLLIPIVTDGISVLSDLILVFYRRPAKTPAASSNTRVSVVIPAYNEQHTINRLLLSLRAQSYPRHLLEVIVVDDGSSDGTVNSVLRHIGTQTVVEGLRTSSFVLHSPHFGGNINIIRRRRGQVDKHGKSPAVNAGIALSTGDLVFSVDADVILAPDAIENAVQAFQQDPDMVAATGHLIIDPYLIVETDKNGRTIADKYGLPVSKSLNASENLLASSQFLEYLTAFHLGRHAESIMDTMFTMSGACAIFRREVFEQVGTFDDRTVSEDTDMTLSIHELGDKRIGYLVDTQIHLAPEISWADLYAQRVRWQRGALEVVAAHSDKKHSTKSRFWRLAMPLRMQVDHTLAMPRMVWTFLIFLLPLFGYSWTVIRNAFLLLILFYLVVNILRVMTAYFFSTPPEKVFVRRYLPVVPLIPFYNFFLFWARMSAIMHTLTEDSSWRVDNTLLRNLENSGPFRSTVRGVTQFIAFLF